MATLDYALLAEYARVDSAGLLTAVGASFDRVHATDRSARQQLFVVIRALLDEEGDSSVAFTVTIRPPSGQFAIGLTGVAARNEAAVSVDGKVAVIMTIGVAVPLSESGRYSVSVALGEETRELPFVVEHTAPAGA